MSIVRPGAGTTGNASQETAFKDANFYTGGFNGNSLHLDPLITGFAFIIWTKVPEWVLTEYPAFKEMAQKNFQGIDGLADIELNSAAVTGGFTTNEYHIAQNMGAKPNTFNLKHNEYSGSPVRNAYTHWVSGIRDPETGIATYPKQYGVDYAAKNHTGELMYIVTRPDANNIEKNIIEFAAYWTACMPKRINLGHLNYTKGTQETPIEIEQPFSGIMHMSPKVDEAAQKMLKAKEMGFEFVEQAEYAIPSSE